MASTCATPNARTSANPKARTNATLNTRTGEILKARTNAAPKVSMDGSSILPGSKNWEPVRKRLLSPDLKESLQAATELREGIEIVHTNEFSLMLSALLPAFSSILAHRTRPSADTTTIDHKLRNIILEIISRMPSNEILRPHAPHLVAVAMDILNRDYEDNALIASCIIFDLYKIYRSLPQDYVQPYLDFVQSTYRTLPSAVQRNFHFPSLAAAASSYQPTSSMTADLTISATLDLLIMGKEQPSLKKVEGTSTPAVGAPVTTPATSPESKNSQLSPIPTTPTPRLTLKSNASFRVLTECPLVVMLMFQLYPKFLEGNIPILIKVMIETLSLKVPPLQSIATPSNQKVDANIRRVYFSRAHELVAAQAKTLSFLAYLIRGFSNELKPYEDRLANNIVALMSTCPHESISTRKELLVATRLFLNSDFRNGFFRHVDAFLDERVLIGSHYRHSDQAVLRPLGLTALSDLIHHGRSLLNMTQMSKVVSMFSRALHDSNTALPMSTQHTAVRTLLSAVDVIFHNKDQNPQIGRDMLVRILSTLVDKLSTLKDCFHMQKDKEEKLDGIGGEDIFMLMAIGPGPLHFPEDHTSYLNENGDWKERKLHIDKAYESTDSLQDLRGMIRAIVMGLKTVIWYISNYYSQREKDKGRDKVVGAVMGSNEEVSSAMLRMTNSERALIDKYIVLALPSTKFLKEHDSANVESSGNLQNKKQSSSDQYRDVLSYFAATFTNLDSYNLRRTLGSRLDLIVDAIFEDSAVMTVPRQLLGSNATTSKEFCSLLSMFLVERIDELSWPLPHGMLFSRSSYGIELNEDQNPIPETNVEHSREQDEKQKQRATTYLQLFECVLKSLSVYPENEGALRPYLRFIVATCLRLSMENVEFWPDNCCMLLRYVFRSISAGKFEESYKELLPLIPTVLNGLHRVLCTTDTAIVQHTSIELCLTIPARLSSLLPHMSLLIRVIIRALESSSGDLVNLGLRTLEFWVDNLNPDFLYPELSKESTLLSDLMKALSCHLRPAPYPYGLLTLRLLGKLGGKNRRFLREPFDDHDITDGTHTLLAIQCNWALAEDQSLVVDSRSVLKDSNPEANTHGSSSTPNGDSSFCLPLPLDRCLEILSLIARTENHDDEKTHSLAKEPLGNSQKLLWKESSEFWTSQIEQVDFESYCEDVMKKTRQSQAEAALHVVRAALAAVLAVRKGSFCDFDNEPSLVNDDGKSGKVVSDVSDTEVEMNEPSLLICELRARNLQLKRIGLCLMHACVIESIRTESLVLLRGFVTHMFLIVTSHNDCFIRIDANGSRIEDLFSKSSNDPDLGDERLGSLQPFGYFQQSGLLKNTLDPLVLNEAIAHFLTETSSKANEIGLDLLKHLLSLSQRLEKSIKERLDLMETGNKPTEKTRSLIRHRGSRIFFENLLSRLCVECLSSHWNRRSGLHEGICLLIEEMGREWSRKYEIEIMNVALFAAKSVPRELSTSVLKAFTFFTRICMGLYGTPESLSAAGEGEKIVHDVLHVTSGKLKPENSPGRKVTTQIIRAIVHIPCDAVLQVLFTEMGSTKHISRIAARFLLKHFVIEILSAEDLEKLLGRHLPAIRRVVFSRSLRLLPLPEQVGAVEALSFFMKEVKSLLPLKDQHLLAFLSELLKMSSVADGEMAESSLSGYVVDKNGYVTQSHKKNASIDPKEARKPSHASALFFRRECIVQTQGIEIIIPEELPSGTQLRVSSICLLHSVIRGHADAFFDAEVSTPIGNIRPHVVSLLFRSLVSSPEKAVIAAHNALRDVLSLSVVPKDSKEAAKSQSRLPKELLQTCIRPVLLNLREYTRLTVPLLRGLSRLLSLLSSWFNKTLGEKLLDHMQKWTDPNLITSHRIWTEGDEPSVAVAIVNLFALLPHASHFVEPLVKSIIKLEAALPRYKSRYIFSPYRRPLAKYLNKHCQYTAAFFFPRLQAPIYSELFQDIVRSKESEPLRTYLSGRYCSNMILNACFEKPLAIIRNEKTLSSASPLKLSNNPSAEAFALHGIQKGSPPRSQREALLRQDIEVKTKKLQILQQEFNRTKEALQTKAVSTSTNTSSPDLQQQHNMAKAAFERGAKEMAESKQRLAAEIAKSSSPQGSKASASVSPRPMSTESLELQYQGFLLVKTLTSNNEKYLLEHNDLVRAFRWLWRSKGRQMRLQHECSVSPRFHWESKMLASFLIRYARSFPNDVDVLFELIRIFLQPSTSDFSFVRRFLSESVSNLLSADQKKQVMQLFFSLLTGENTEEMKALSIRLLVFPMLSSVFRNNLPTLASSTLKGQIRPSSNETKPQSPLKPNKEISVIFDTPTLKKFVTEVLFEGGKPITFGERLMVDLLRLLNLLIQHLAEDLDQFRSELLRFCWSQIKSKDTLCKTWAYVVVCRFISVFETSPNIVLQVFTALLRSHQQEGRYLVRSALRLLVPALRERLNDEDFSKAMDYTKRIMFEDGNSTPQLAHVWHTIVANSEVYSAHIHQFVRYMINSLNRLGFPPNCPPENRALAISMIGLLIDWDGERQSDKFEREQTSEKIGAKRQKLSEGNQPAKKFKNNHGSVIPFLKEETLVVLDKNMADTLANFLVRLKVLLAEQKIEDETRNLDLKITKIFRKIILRWKSIVIQSVYFDKAVSMCIEDNVTESPNGKDTEIKKEKSLGNFVKTGRNSSSVAQDSALKNSKSKQATPALLTACLDIFTVIVEEAPNNDFLVRNSSQLKEILGSCFRYICHNDEAMLREKLQVFIVGFFKASDMYPKLGGDIVHEINAFLEKFLLNGDEMQNNQLSTSPQGHRGATAANVEDYSVTQFSLETIHELCKNRRQYYKNFASSLLVLANNLVKKHISDTSAKQKQGVCYAPQSGTCGIPQMCPTPVIGIMEEACSKNPSYTIAGGISRQVEEKQETQTKESLELETPLKTLVLVLHMIGSGNVPYSFTEDRKVLLQVISSILDTSDNVQLLMTAVKIVGKWLLADDSGGPLTVKERNSFLWKISSFDFNSLPDVVSQPLSDLVAHFVISFLGDRVGDTLSAPGQPYSIKLKGRSGRSQNQKVTDSDDMIMGRLLVACLLNANEKMRSELFSLFTNQNVDPRQESGCGRESSEITSVKTRSPIDILWQLLHSDFEGLGGRLWIVVFVELFLDSTKSYEGIRLFQESKTHSQIGEKCHEVDKWLPCPIFKNKAESDRDEYFTFTELILTEQSKGQERCLSALRRLVHGDVVICKRLFETLLPIAWENIPSDEMRLQLVPAIESLLSRPYHSQFLKQVENLESGRCTSNVLRSFLNALWKLRPLPLLDSDLLVSLAENYNSWYEVLSLLEHQYSIFAASENNKHLKRLGETTLAAMRHCYRKLGESGLWITLACESCKIPESLWAISIDAYDSTNEAVEAYSNLVDLTQTNDSRIQDTSEFEMSLWEERWVELQRELCQLQVVSEFASLSENLHLLLECAWKSQDWDKVRTLTASSGLVAAVEGGDPTVKMSESMLAVADRKLSEVENLHAQTAQLCLYKWQLLPNVSQGNPSHASLLHFFHRLVEIRESGQIMVETSNHSNGRTLPDLKNLLNAWRHRLPNEYEKLTIWDDVFTWRAHMFSAILSNFQWSEPNTLATLHDRPWTAIRIAKTARKQGMREVALLLMNKLTESRSMDVSDAFLKLREQILTYYNPDSDLERTGGLNLINTTNLSFFDPTQKSELFRLKAMFLASLGGRSKANQAYCHSVQICANHARSWVSWGGLCSNLGALQEKQIEQGVSKGEQMTKEIKASSAKKVAQYLAQSMGCYFEAVQLEAHEWARIHLPKCLLMLTKDGSSPGVLCQTLENRGAALPAWVWLPWIPQLLSCLCRIEGRAVKAIVAKLVKSHPQAIYFSLRAFYLERRDVERSKTSEQSPGSHMASVSYAEEMMSTLRRSHASLWSSLESILEELIVKFRPSYEEELLATITALLDRAESQPGSHAVTDKTRVEEEDALVASVSKTLGRIAVKFFRTTDTNSIRQDERSRKTAEFKHKYKALFEADFLVSSTEQKQPLPSSTEQRSQEQQLTLEQYVVVLKKWKRRLEVQVQCTPLSMPLVESSHSLAMFYGDASDLWPGSCDPRPSNNNSSSLERRDTNQNLEVDNRGSPSSTSSSAAAARKAAITAALTAAKSATKEGAGGDFGGGSASIEIPGQYVPNLCASSDVKPCPELHTKLIRFEPTVQVLRRNDQLVRRIGMMGSDGKTYRFLLQFAIPYWTRTDERAAQTYYVLDKVLRKGLKSSRQYLSVQPTAVIPVAQRLRLTADVDSRISLDEVYKRHCESLGRSTTDSISSYYNDETSKLIREKWIKQGCDTVIQQQQQEQLQHGKDINTKINTENNEIRKKIEKESRIEVFHKICAKVDGNILRNHMQSVLDGPEPFYQFRRAFSEQLASNSLLQYVFAVTERNPSRFVFLQSNGQILSPDFRVTYNSQGFIESRKLPFRMTPNVLALIGQPLLHGRFIITLSTIAETIREHREETDPIWRLLMRDDIVAWYCKSLAKSDSKTQELEKQLTDRVAKNVSYIHARFGECSPSTANKKDNQNPKGGGNNDEKKQQGEVKNDPVDKRIRDLIDVASNPEKLCMMPSSYQGWL